MRCLKIPNTKHFHDIVKIEDAQALYGKLKGQVVGEVWEAEVEEEFGDLLFVMANLARHLGVDPEAALRGANAKFTRRFGRIEDWLEEAGKRPADSDLAEMDALWDRAKVEEKAGKT